MRLTAEQCRALELLASSQRGATQAVMIVHGFKTEMLAGLVLAGAAMVCTEIVMVGGETIKIDRFMITDTGRQALLE